MRSELVAEVFDRLEKQNPKPTIELKYKDSFTLLVAVVLSAQSTDIRVNLITKGLFKVADSPEKMLELGEQKLREYIKSIGLYNNKAKNIIALSSDLIIKHNGKVPSKFNELVALPGVGRKSANVLLNSFFSEATIAVDTHVFRVSNRIGLVNAKNVLDTEQQLLLCVPKDKKLFAHHWLVLHGRYTCKAKKPLCDTCCISDLCKFYNSNLKAKFDLHDNL